MTVCCCLYHTRIEEFAKEKVDLTLATCPEFNTPLTDLTEVKTMMDSINVIPGVVYILNNVAVLF